MESSRDGSGDRNEESDSDRNGLSDGRSNGDGNWDCCGRDDGGEFEEGDLALDCSGG